MTKAIENDYIDFRLKAGKKLFFLSDFHLGAPTYNESRERERKIVAWLEAHEKEMGGLFLLGDVFDYWFEYRYVVPKGYVRLLAALARLADKGIPVYFFCGNHDAWVRNYFQKEIGLRVCEQNARLLVRTEGLAAGADFAAGAPTKFYLGHGDGLGPDDKGYKRLKRLFAARWARSFFSMLHPWTGYVLAVCFSRRSRQADERKENRAVYEQKKNEQLMYFMRDMLTDERDIRYFIFAHRHWPQMQEVVPFDEAEAVQPEAAPLEAQADTAASAEATNAQAAPAPTLCHYLNVGDWLQYFSYGVYDGKELQLQGECIEKTF